MQSQAPPPTPRRQLVRHAAQGYGVAATSWRGSLALYPLYPGQAWSFDAAFERVWRELIARLPGEPWKSA
jgi:hypothetical protein